MQAQSNVLEINVISAEDLRFHSRPINRKAFVSVQTDAQNHHSTKINTQDGSYPSWNEKFHLPLEGHVRSISLQVHCQSVMGTVTVGIARIPVSDFMGDYTPPHYLHFLSYILRDPKGRRNGIINLSLRIKVPRAGSGVHVLNNESCPGSAGFLPPYGYKI